MKLDYTPSELKKLKNVKVFLVSIRMRETFPIAIKRNQKTAIAYAKKTGGQIYTGVHRSNDWSVVAWWRKGMHLVNRTGDYAVIW